MSKVFWYGIDNKAKLVKIVELIPLSWSIIEGTLKAPKELDNLSDIYLSLSGHIRQINRKKDISKRLEFSGEKLFESINNKMNPLEVRFDWYLKENFWDVKSELKKYLSLGYHGVIGVSEKQIEKGYFRGTNLLLDSREYDADCFSGGKIQLIGNPQDKSFKLFDDALANLNLKLIEKHDDPQNEYRKFL